MKKYYFSDDNEGKDAVCDIKGSSFDVLLLTYLQYCTCFSLDIVCLSGSKLDSDSCPLQGFEMPGFPWEKYQSIWRYFEIHPVQENAVRLFYHFNNKTMSILRTLFDSLFFMPKVQDAFTLENLTFFRPDMTVFFCCETHEGDAFLFVKDKENVNSLLIEDTWKEVPISTIGFLHNVEMPWRDS